jgi:hypothetical protein
MLARVFSLIIFTAITTNIFAYNAATSSGKNVESFAIELKNIVEDYKSYTKVVDPHAVRIIRLQYVSNGNRGAGAYYAQGGSSFNVGYRGSRAKYSYADAVGNGIDGEDLYGYRLHSLYESAILLDNFKQDIAKVFSVATTGTKVSQLKDALLETSFVSVLYILNFKIRVCD